MPRFILLEHTAAPNDPAGLHYDLLLEQGDSCRTWRLAGIPARGGAEVNAVEVAPHRLAWLDHEAGAVSGGRGFARRIDGGPFERMIPPAGEATPEAAVHVTLRGDRLAGRLLLRALKDHWLARLDAPDVP